MRSAPRSSRIGRRPQREGHRGRERDGRREHRERSPGAGGEIAQRATSQQLRGHGWYRRACGEGGNPRFKVHFTPTHASWMNLWFSLVERQAVRRGVFRSVPDGVPPQTAATVDDRHRAAHPSAASTCDVPQASSPADTSRSEPAGPSATATQTPHRRTRRATLGPFRPQQQARGKVKQTRPEVRRRNEVLLARHGLGRTSGRPREPLNAWSGGRRTRAYVIVRV